MRRSVRCLTSCPLRACAPPPLLQLRHQNLCAHTHTACGYLLAHRTARKRWRLHFQRHDGWDKSGNVAFTCLVTRTRPVCCFQPPVLAVTPIDAWTPKGLRTWLAFTRYGSCIVPWFHAWLDAWLRYTLRIRWTDGPILWPSVFLHAEHLPYRQDPEPESVRPKRGLLPPLEAAISVSQLAVANGCSHNHPVVHELYPLSSQIRSRTSASLAPRVWPHQTVLF